jgi:hypothetical protein
VQISYGRSFFLLLSLITASYSHGHGAGCASAVEAFLRAGTYASKAPTTSIVISAELELPTAQILSKLRAGDADLESGLSYVIDYEDHLFFVRSPLEAPAGNQILVDGALSGRKLQFPAKQMGAISYNHLNHSFEFVPKTSHVDLAASEMNLLEDATSNLVRFDRTSAQEARLIECSQVLADHERGKSFIMNSLVTNLGLNTGAYAIQDPTRFVDPNRRDLLFADYTSTAASTIFKSAVGKYITTSSMSYLARTSIRAGTGVTSAQLQGLVIRNILHDDANSGRSSDNRSNRIVGYNTGYTLFSVLKGDLVDGTILKKLPSMYFDMCLKGSSAKLFVSPGMFRLVESLGSTVIFYVGRKMIINE